MNPQPISLSILRQKYATLEEADANAVRRRVAYALARHEQEPKHWEAIFFYTLTAGFIPGGRINAAAGTKLKSTLTDPISTAIRE
jgi:ribonucleoside-diphosphate reductase alpha chain